MIPSYTLYTLNDNDCLYDLSNGSLDSEKIGVYDGETPIFSAERLLMDLEDIMDQGIVRKINVMGNKIEWEEP